MTIRKSIITHNEKEYKVLMAVFDKAGGACEILIYPIENGISSDKEIYLKQTTHAVDAYHIYTDIKENPEKYVSDKAIEKYFACRDCSEWCCTMCKYWG